MKVHNFTIDSSQRDTGAYPNANNYVIDLENNIYNVTEIKLISARVPTPMVSPFRPNSIILKLSTGSDDFNQTIFASTPHYTGHILLDDTDKITFNGTDDPLIYRFHSGPQKTMKDLHVEFLYLNAGELDQYTFGVGDDHVLKFEITCSTNKLENLTPMKLEPEKEEEEKLPEISIPPRRNLYEWKIEYIYITLIIFTGFILIMSMGKKRS